jgi:hypothetical protein
MKKLLIFSLLLFAAMSCSKKSDPTPADQINGDYVMTRLTTVADNLSYDLPINAGANKLSGTLSVTKKSEKDINIAFTFTSVTNGNTENKSDNFDLNIKQNGNNVDIYSPENTATPIGSYNNGTITIEGDEIKIVGKKKYFFPKMKAKLKFGFL